MATNSKEYNKKNYMKYWGNLKAKKDRAARNKARREMIKSGRVRKWDRKEVDHKDNNPQNNSKNNLSVVSREYNRRKWAKKANGK